MTKKTARRNFIGFAPAFLLPAMASAAKIPNETKDAAKVKVEKDPFGDSRVYWEGSTDQIKSMIAGSVRLKPGGSPHPPHMHPEEEFVLVTEGNGEIMVDGKTSKVGPGAMMFCGGNKSHGIVNTGKTPLLFYFYKWMV